MNNPISSQSEAATSTDELQTFIQKRSYYYLPRWHKLDPTLKSTSPGTFNWAACFFAVFWMAYRKMYLYVVIWLLFMTAVETIISLLFPASNYANGGLAITMMYLFGVHGSALYRRHVERKLRAIKKSMSSDFWAQGFKDKGGTSLLAPIPIIALKLVPLFAELLRIAERTR